MTDLVVPDSIEPVLGYKALRVTADGKFLSPQQQTPWPVKKPLEALCAQFHNQPTDWKWVAVKGTPKPWHTPLPAPNPHPTTVATFSQVLGSPPEPEPQPQTELPPGMSWSWEAVPHEAVQNSCGCGIYAVDTPAHALGYCTPDSVLVQVALWGRTIKASQGARGQYSYPQKIVSLATLLTDDGRAQLAAENYGIPIDEDEDISGAPVYSITTSGASVGWAPMPNFTAPRGGIAFAGPATTPSSSPSATSQNELQHGEKAAFAIVAAIVLTAASLVALTGSWPAFLSALVLGLAACVGGFGMGVTSERQ